MYLTEYGQVATETWGGQKPQILMELELQADVSTLTKAGDRTWFPHKRNTKC